MVRIWVRLKRDVYRVCGCYRGDIVVIDVFWRRLICSGLGKGATSESGKYLFRAANVWWNCAQYFGGVCPQIQG